MKKKYLLELFILSVIIFSFDIILSKYSFPLTEGWWETYSWIGKNKNLYEEVNLSFPPLFILIQGLILKFNDNLLVIRIIYCLIHLFEFFLLTKVVGIFFDRKYAIIGAFIAEVLMVIKNPVWIVKDYHLIVSILELMIIIFSYKLYRVKNNLSIINAIILSILFSLIILLKQNIALIIIFTSMVIFIFAFKNRKVLIYNILAVLSFTSLFIILFSHFYGVGWINTYIKNDSKGSFLTVFLRIIQEPSARDILVGSLVIFIIVNIVSVIYEIIYKDFIVDNKLIILKKFNDANYLLKFNLIYILFTYILIGAIFFWNSVYLYMIISSFALCRLNLYKIFSGNWNQDNECIYLMLIGIIYTGTMTAGFNSVSMEIPTAFFIAYLISLIYINRTWINILLISALIIFSIYGFYTSKVKSNSYDWWGYSVGSVIDAKYESENKKLAGIGLDKNTEEILNKTSYFMRDKKSTLLSYPSIPIFYYLYEKQPIISSPVLWFDVYSSKNLNYDMQLLRENNPDYIFWLKPSAYAYEGHSLMKTSKLPLASIDEYILNLVGNGKYRVVYIKPIIGGNDMDGINIYKKNITSPINAEFNCNKCDRSLLDQMNNDDSIIKYEYSNFPGKILVVFKNNFYLADFIEKNYLTPIKTDMNIFFILEKMK